MAAFAACHVPGPAGPDVHLHELPQPGLSGQGRGHRRRDLRRAGRDGHRRRLVRARVAGLRLRLPVAPASGWPGSTRACRSCADMWTTGLGDAGRASTTRSTARAAGRCRCRTAASRCGSPAAARRRRCGRRPSTRRTRTSTPARRCSSASRRSWQQHCRDVGRDFDEITRSGNYNVVIGETEPDVQDRLARIAGPLPAARAGRRAGGARCATIRTGPARRARRSRSSSGSRRPRPLGPGLRDHLLRRGGLRHLGHRAVRARGHPGVSLSRMGDDFDLFRVSEDHEELRGGRPGGVRGQDRPARGRGGRAGRVPAGGVRRVAGR